MTASGSKSWNGSPNSGMAPKRRYHRAAASPRAPSVTPARVLARSSARTEASASDKTARGAPVCGPRRSTLTWWLEIGDDRPRTLKAAVPLAGPAFCPGPGPSCSSTRGARCFSRPNRPTCDLVALWCPPLREVGWIALSSPRLARAPYVRASTARCLPVPLLVARPLSMTALSHAADSAWMRLSRPIPNSHSWHKACLYLRGIAPRDRCIGGGCAAFLPETRLTPRAASGRRSPSPA